MNADRLFALYDRVADAPDAVGRLRRFVLDLAVRGKLVEQDPADEPASELLRRIAAEKARLVAAGGIRRRKVPSALDERPFSVPENWHWARVREIASDRGQKIPEEPFTYIDVTAIDKENGLVVGPRVLEPSEAPSRARKVAQLGDVVYSCVRPYLLNIAVIEADFDPLPIASTAFEILNGHGFVLPRYIWIVLRSPFMVACVEKSQRGQAYPAINSADFAVLPFPLPPLAEQHRIVAKVDELMALCDQLEETRTAREDTRDRLTKASLARLSAADTDVPTFRSHARFAVDALPALTARADQVKHLRQTILSVAVQGKLVEQDPADEPASELLRRIEEEGECLARHKKTKKRRVLPPIDPECLPFDLPQGWSWATFPELGLFGRGKSRHRPRNDPILFIDGTYPMVQTGDVARSNGVISTYTSKYNETGLAQSMLWPKGTLCITIAANIADSGILSFDACFPDSVVGLIPSLIFQNSRYFEYFMRTAKDDLLEFAPSTAQKNINLGILETLLIPLPPLAEQRRIVAKVDELMALCDRIEAGLAASDGIRSRLLESLLHDALAFNTYEAATARRVEA